MQQIINYKNAFKCKKCPQSNGMNGCPVWWETVWEQPGTQPKLIKACGFTQFPLYIIELIKASNRPAATIEEMRNETAIGLEKIAMGLIRVAQVSEELMKQDTINHLDNPQIEDKPGNNGEA
ncbi:hypothetical protein LCGC14_1756780 [marine sediment metagenome]|uniref:Uncharacterized protein n=1 Tax=marine sediment metagenome TaxID=412755 RepID=A0A0F9H299_9ZZZZ